MPKHHDGLMTEILERINEFLKEGIHLLRESLRLEHEILRHLREDIQRTTQLVTVFGDDTMAATLPGSEVVGQSVIATLVAYEADGITATPGAVVSAQVWDAVSDATIATLTANADGTATFVALAAGTLTGSVSATVTDVDGTVLTLTGSYTLVVTTSPTGRSASLQVSFGIPA
jgi:hypothetical protein